MKKSIKWIVLIALLAVVGGLVAVYFQKSENLGGPGWYSSTLLLSGTATASSTRGYMADYRLTKLPSEDVYADTTSTPLTEDGGVINQKVDTRGLDQIKLCVAAIGGTATSTLGITQMVSWNGLDYFNLATNTTDWYINGNATTTMISTGTTTIGFDPGTATTTQRCWALYTYGYNYTRLILNGEDHATDPNDGVKAWIMVGRVETSNN